MYLPFGVFFFLFILYGIFVKTQPFTNVLFASDFCRFLQSFHTFLAVRGAFKTLLVWI